MGHYNNARQIPRVAAIHDLSCFGRSALTAVIPILSVMGAQVVPIPTALLSTHTGGFEGLHFRDLTSDLCAIIAHFEKLELKFDAIYSGFLGSADQIDLVEKFIDNFGADIPVLVDPVMGDGGRPYQTYTPELIAGMEKLCHKAGIITPNLTEACFLTGIKMPEREPDNEDGAAELADTLIQKLRESYGDINIVITGIGFADRIGNACALSAKDRGREQNNCRKSGSQKNQIRQKEHGFNMISTPRYRRSFPGTGEVFSSTLLGSLLSGADFLDATEKAINFTCNVISLSQSSRFESRDGVLLEACLGELIIKH